MLKLIYRILILLAAVSILRCNGSRILLLPTNHKSHVHLLGQVGEMLAERGHLVDLLSAPVNAPVVADRRGVNFVTYRTNITVRTIDFVKEMWKEEEAANPLSMLMLLTSFATKIFNPYFLDMANDADLDAYIRSRDYDLVFCDSTLEQTNLLVAYKYDIPYVIITPAYQQWLMKFPGLIAAEPSPMMAMFNPMSFHERALNVLLTLAFNFALPLPYVVDYRPVYDAYLPPDKPHLSFTQLHRRAELYFIDFDMHILNEPRVTIPAFVFLKGISGAAPKQLPSDLDAIMQNERSKTHGVVIMTFGSLFRDIPEPVLRKLLDAFRAVPQTVIGAYSGKPIEKAALPDNVHLGEWLPQNDLLGHRNTRVFITHSGIKGLIEAVAHGVPLICFPFAGDQRPNAARVAHKGLGLVMDIRSFDADELRANIEMIAAADSKWAQQMKRASKIYQALPMAKDQLIFWTEHVIAVGGAHLRHPGLDLPWYQLLLLDVMAVATLVWVIVTYALYKCCRLVCCKRKNTETTPKDKKD